MRTNPPPIEVIPVDHSTDRSSQETPSQSSSQQNGSPYWSKQTDNASSSYQRAQTYPSGNTSQNPPIKSRFSGLIQIVVGIIMFLVGIPLLLLPGPGLLTIGAGITLIALGAKNVVTPRKTKAAH